MGMHCKSCLRKVKGRVKKLLNLITFREKTSQNLYTIFTINSLAEANLGAVADF